MIKPTKPHTRAAIAIIGVAFAKFSIAPLKRDLFGNSSRERRDYEERRQIVFFSESTVTISGGFEIGTLDEDDPGEV